METYLWILHWPPIIDFDLSVNTIIGKLLFKFTMPSLSEEILFRALALGILMRSWKGCIRLGKLEIPITGLIASIFFCIAHIGFSFSPFQITCDPMQLVFAFVFGIFYSILFDKTKSLLGPILAHNAIDGFGTIIDIILTLILP